MTEPWRDGETAVLRRPGEPPRLVVVRAGAQRLGESSVLDLGEQIGRLPGGEFAVLGAPHRLFRPTLGDLFATLERGAQIVGPKDAAYLSFLAGVGPGARVVEAGAGSGALTTALAFLVGPEGRVTTYDRRPEFLATARRNVTRAGFAPRVEFVERDVARDGFDRDDQASVLLDLAEPWEVAGAALRALAPGGSVGAYTPTYNQLERTVRALRATGFLDVRSLELIERPIHVGDGGTRPEFDMLGHTGFLSCGRRGG